MKGAAPTSLPNIILIGLMGCGKTTIGKELHRETSLRFTDTDQMIEHQTGMSIAWGGQAKPHYFNRRRHHY